MFFVVVHIHTQGRIGSPNFGGIFFSKKKFAAKTKMLT
jgi:hypothetical protein